MSSQFYSRYIPPSSKVTITVEKQRSSKKRKTIKPIATLPPSQEENPIPERLEQGTVVQAADQEASLPTEQQSVANEQDIFLRSRHQAVLSKYQKAKKESAEKPRTTAAIEDKPIEAQDDQMEIESHGLEPLPQPTEVQDLPKVSMSTALPEWLQSATHVSPASTVPFQSLPINENAAFSLQEKGFEKAFAIQAAVLPMLLPGPQDYSGDICISAATGSGKTLAYTLPMVESLREKPVTKLRGLIVVPTRELVSQVKETFDLCSGGSGLKIGTAMGSKTFKEEQAQLVEKGQKYDPEAYRAEQEKEIDEDEELMDWDFEKRFGPKDGFELLYNHVVEYNSRVDVLICTPGRLVEHIQSTAGFTLEHVQWLVIDEADRLLDESFQQWIDVVLPGLEYLPPLDPIQERFSNTFHLRHRREVRKIILSATMTRDISKLTALKLRRPRLVVLEGQAQEKPEAQDKMETIEATERIELPTTLQEIGVKVPDANDKPLYLIQLLESKPEIGSEKASVKPIEPQRSSESEDTSLDESTSQSHSDRGKVLRNDARTAPQPVAPSATHGTLIFTKTNEHATRLAHLLSLLRPAWGPQIATLTKSSTSSSRQKALSAFRKRKLSILIASDRASRGLDIPDLTHVINYDMPSSLTSYVHRVGRTARAGKEGKAATLIADNEARWFWNEIARSEKVGRGKGKKVVRIDRKLEVEDEEREMYKEALEKLGEETRGKHE
ncbi:hypothetical protein ABVK25_004979 [Lepraria finkii]|uniref:ATP-dependent RNA helicase n=1 Tax=Lepraria finkii TaxID=1340010 RepID=A0ABR4BAL2_9LECA